MNTEKIMLFRYPHDVQITFENRTGYYLNGEYQIPVFAGSSPISLSSVLEPVANLCWTQPSQISEFPLPGGVGVGILEIPLSQQIARLLLEAVTLLLAVPDGSRQRELLAHAVLVDGS